MSDEPTNPPSYPSPSQSTLPYIVQEAGQASVIQTSDLVAHDPDRVSRNQDPIVSHDLPEPDRVIQNEANDQQKPCSTRPEPGRDTNGKACSTKRAVHPIATRMNARKDWVQGLGTARFIAQKYNLAYSTVRAWYKQDNWTSARNQWIKNQMIAHAPIPAPPPIIPIAPASPLSDKIKMIESQLEALDLMLAKAKTPEDWQKLTNSKDKLLQNFYVLAGIAKPAARKAGRTTPQRVQPIEPVEPGNP